MIEGLSRLIASPRSSFSIRGKQEQLRAQALGFWSVTVLFRLTGSFLLCPPLQAPLPRLQFINCMLYDM